MVFFCDINGLMKTLILNHYPTDWRLFIDSSKLRSLYLFTTAIVFLLFLLVMLLSWRRLMQIWQTSTQPNILNVSGKLEKKVFAILWEMQLGYIKLSCFYACGIPGILNHIIFLPPILIKLGLMKNFVNGINREG